MYVDRQQSSQTLGCRQQTVSYQLSPSIPFLFSADNGSSGRYAVEFRSAVGYTGAPGPVFRKRTVSSSKALAWDWSTTVHN